MPEVSYALTKHLPRATFEDAAAKVTEALAGEGFGVLTEIDIKATLKKKLDVDFPRYTILGACNPSLAHRALQAEPAIGLLLPCNVVVAEGAEGGTTVSIAAPRAMFSIVDRADLQPIVDDVQARLERVIAAL